MKPAIIVALALALPLTAAFAWNQTGGAAGTGTVKTASLNTYTGVSINGNLQEALNDALAKAAAAATKTTADAQFTWTLGQVSGKRGGITGSQEIDVQIMVPITVGGAR